MLLLMVPSENSLRREEDYCNAGCDDVYIRERTCYFLCRKETVFQTSLFMTCNSIMGSNLFVIKSVHFTELKCML